MIAKSGYEQHKSRQADAQRKQAQQGRDIGPIPPIGNVKRRRRCEKSLRLFAETYNPQSFLTEWGAHWPWCSDQIEVIAAIEKAVREECMSAFAMPRGTAKTALCRTAILWAVSNALVPYVFLVGANEDKAIEGLDTVKLWMRTLPEYCEDFPEIAAAVRALGGIANRASGQLCQGSPTWIKWEKDRIVLPTVPKPPNMTWHKGDMAPSSGIVVGVSGLTGDGIRGSLFPHPDGRLIRPKLVLLDDPQTDESASSPAQNASRFRLIRGAVLGMAGPGSKISAVMPITVQFQGDMADKALDRKQNPAWRGIRKGILKSMPKNMDAWEKYFEVYRACISSDNPNVKPANKYYRDHRSELDDGAEASWKHRKGQAEVSAIQHAMNIYCERGAEVFWSEYMNTPMERHKSLAALKLKPNVVANKLSGVPRSIVPKECEHLTAFIDVGLEVLHWAVSAWSEGFSGGPIDYGTYPEQPTAYFSKGAVPRKLGQMPEYVGMTDDAFIIAALTALSSQLINRTFTREDSREMRISKLLVDIKWGEKNKLLRTWCRRHPHHGRIVHASQGFGFSATSIPMANYRPDGAKSGEHWRNGPPKNGDIWVTVDTNWWKSLTAARLLMPLGTAGSWQLFGRDPAEHAMFADHCCVEEPVEVTAKGQTVTEWKSPPGVTDNDYWDCFVGTAVAASMAGCQIPGQERVVKKNERLTLAEMKARAR